MLVSSFSAATRSESSAGTEFTRLVGLCGRLKQLIYRLKFQSVGQFEADDFGQ